MQASWTPILTPAGGSSKHFRWGPAWSRNKRCIVAGYMFHLPYFIFVHVFLTQVCCPKANDTAWVTFFTCFVKYYPFHKNCIWKDKTCSYVSMSVSSSYEQQQKVAEVKWVSNAVSTSARTFTSYSDTTSCVKFVYSNFLYKCPVKIPLDLTAVFLIKF